MQLLKEFSIKPNNIHLYELAFLHESYSNENDIFECYERLEFLGDAVLDLVVSEFLYNMDSNLTEGQLTRMRSNYVCKKAIYIYSTEIGLDKYIKLYDFAPSGYITVSTEGKIIEINLCGSQMLAEERSNVIGRKLGFFISDDTKPIFSQFLETV